MHISKGQNKDKSRTALTQINQTRATGFQSPLWSVRLVRIRLKVASDGCKLGLTRFSRRTVRELRWFRNRRQSLIFVMISAISVVVSIIFISCLLLRDTTRCRATLDTSFFLSPSPILAYLQGQIGKDHKSECTDSDAGNLDICQASTIAAIIARTRIIT